MHLFSVGDLTLLGKVVSKDFPCCRVAKRNRRCFLGRAAAGGDVELQDKQQIASTLDDSSTGSAKQPG